MADYNKDMDNDGSLMNAINVRYGSSTELLTHWAKFPVDGPNVRVVDAEIASDAASEEEIENMEHVAFQSNSMLSTSKS